MTILLIIVGAVVAVFLLSALTGAPYVPSFRNELRIAFTKLYELNEKDFVVDLGSGDGVVLSTAAEFGAGGLGLEINPVLVLISRLRLRKYKNVKIHNKNLFSAKFPPETTVVYVFGERRDIERMVRHIKSEATRLHKTLFLISYGFEVPGMKATKKERAYMLYEISPNR